jgi:sRNA-binding protein
MPEEPASSAETPPGAPPPSAATQSAPGSAPQSAPQSAAQNPLPQADAAGGPDAVEAAGGAEQPALEAAAAPSAPPRPELTPAACAARLAELFAPLFGTDGPPRPVKLRIHADIQQRAPGVFTRRVLSHFLSRHTTSTAYLKALIASPHRFDLDGNAAGEIAPEHRLAAAEELARRREVHAARRTAERLMQRGDGAAADARQDGGGGTPARDEGRSPPRRDERAQRRRDHPSQRQGGANPPHADRPPRHGHQDNRRPPHPARQRPAQDFIAPAADSPPPALPTDPAQRERALLLHAFESSPLSKANFCTLKGISEADLDAALAQARSERGPRRPR